MKKKKKKKIYKEDEEVEETEANRGWKVGVRPHRKYSWTFHF